MLKFGSKHDSNIIYKCTVRLLEDTEFLECEYRLHHKGKYLLEYVCQQLNLVEQDYFGLRYVDLTNQRHWLDLEKSINKQVKDLDSVLFSFRVKFYPPDPFKLKEEITRYQIFLQLKRDLLHGRLYCATNDAAMLAALVIQSELGDYDPDVHEGNYVSDLKILLKQTPTIEEKAMEIHQNKLKGEDPTQIETKFLKLACPLETYGIDPHPVKFQDHKSTQLYLGINYSGIITFQGSKRTHHFKWGDIQKINYEGKMFIIHVGLNEKHTVGFKCTTGASCRHIWRCAVEQMLFFTLPTGSDSRAVVTGGGFFSWGTKFKYTGRTEREILESASSLSREEPSIKRSSSLRRKASSVPATPSTPLQPHLGYSTLPRSSQSDTGGSRMESSNSTGFLTHFDSNFPIYSDVAALETVSEDHEALRLPKLHTAVLKDDSVEQLGDYYNMKDSFDHSSSESQLIDSSYKDTTNLSYRSSRSQTPQLTHSQVDGRICLPSSSHHIPTNIKKIKKYYVIRRLIPLTILVILFAIIATIIICETDFGILAGFKDIPEMISLRYQIYEPIKEYFKSKISS